MGKGSTRRPCLVSPAEESIRWDLAMGYITPTEFENLMKRLRRRQSAQKENENAIRYRGVENLRGL